MKKILLLVFSIFMLVSCGWQSSNTDIINPDADFLYFYWATCPHCQELNTMLEDGDYLSKIEIEKREVYYNDVNRELFLEVIKKYEISERESWVPFVLNKKTWKYVTGSKEGFDMLTSEIKK